MAWEAGNAAEKDISSVKRLILRESLLERATTDRHGVDEVCAR